jgi:hypothetical protein
MCPDAYPLILLPTQQNTQANHTKKRTALCANINFFDHQLSNFHTFMAGTRETATSLTKRYNIIQHCTQNYFLDLFLLSKIPNLDSDIREVSQSRKM